MVAATTITRSFLHFTAFLVMGIGTWTDSSIIQFGWDTYGGKWKYLTYWDLWLQTLYFAICLSNDLINWRVSNKREFKFMQSFVDAFHATVVFPIGMFVVVTFWVIYAIDRELIFPSYLDEVIPVWLNHIMHTLPLLFLIFDKISVQHRYPSKRNGLLATVFFSGIYMAWILWLARFKGIWVYPILNIFDQRQRTIFLGSLWMFVISMYLVGDGLTTFLWRKPKTKREKVK